MNEYLRLSQVPVYILTKTGVKRSRATVYNWATKGVDGTTLKTEMRSGQMFTQADWVDEFLSVIDQR